MANRAIFNATVRNQILSHATGVEKGAILPGNVLMSAGMTESATRVADVGIFHVTALTVANLAIGKTLHVHLCKWKQIDSNNTI